MPVVTANGLSFHKVEVGQGAPVAMVHGLLLGNLTSWYFTAAPALAKRHRVLMYDLRGHGMSERATSGYDLVTMSRDLSALLNGFTSERCALVGHSYGALVALRFALDQPDRVSKLVLVEAPLPPLRVEELDTLLAGGRNEMLVALPEEMRAAFRQGKRQARKLLDSIRFLALETSLLSDLRAEPDIPDETLADLCSPTLCVYGTRSSCRAVGARLARVLPDARLLELPGGHYLHLDAPAVLTGAIAEFLDG